MRHYLDHASTTPLRASAHRAMCHWLDTAHLPDGTGDPGRVHEEGRRSRMLVEEAREHVARLLNCSASRVVFTASATEAVNTAVFAATTARAGSPIAVAPVEHSSVRRASARAAAVIQLHVDVHGRIDPSHLEDLLQRPDGPLPALVHCQFGNHELSTLQPVADVVRMCNERGVPVHVDAAAAAGHVPIDLQELGADFVSVSSHKLGGPPGAGALVLGRSVRLHPYLVGGAEERGRRAGGENVAGLVGFGAAADELSDPSVLEAESEAARELTRALSAIATEVEGVDLLGPPDSGARLPHIACFTIGGALGEAVLVGLDRRGIAAHSGSACSSEELEPSPVLEAIGADGDRSLRVSVGWSTTEEDVEAFRVSFGAVVGELRTLGFRP